MAGAQSAFDSITANTEETQVKRTMHTGAPQGSQAAVIKGYGQGNLGLAIIGAVLGAAAGGVAWTAIAMVTGWQMSLFAIVLGGLVGFGVGQGNGGRGGFGAGIIAGMFALIGVVGTQFALTQIAMDSARKESTRMSTTDALEDLMWSVYDEYEATGETMTLTADDDFPVEVVAEAERRWNAMSKQEQTAYVKAMHRGLDSVMAESSLLGFGIAYLWTNGWFGLVCAGLSASTAFTIASRDVMAHAKKTGMIPDDPMVVQPAKSGEAGFRAAPAAASASPGGPSAPMKRMTDPSAQQNAAPAKIAVPLSGVTVSPKPTEEIIAEPADAAPAAPTGESAPAAVAAANKPLSMVSRSMLTPKAEKPGDAAPEGPKSEAA